MNRLSLFPPASMAGQMHADNEETDLCMPY